MKRSRLILSLMVVLVIAIGGYYGVQYLFFRIGPNLLDNPPVSMDVYYKYGSVGTEGETGVPYYIWRVLPDLFPDYLPGPGGYAALGMVWEEGQEMPVGFAKQDIGIIPRAGINCATCHTATYRTRPEEPPVVVNGGPSQRFDTLGYQQFLFAAAGDARFTADTLMAAINKTFELSWFEALLYRYAVIPATRRALQQQKEFWAWSYHNPPWGPGRIDPFNPIKFGLLALPVDETVGNSDMMPIWTLNLRSGKHLHWDGLNDSVRDVLLSSAIGDGATPTSLDLVRMKRIETYLMTLESPVYPFAIDETLAATGKEVFASTCATCHVAGQERNGEVIPVEEVGTDPNRLQMWEQKDADAYNGKYNKYEWDFEHFQNNDGYVATPLTGLWLRAPYLHNGSVPSLTDLLKVPEERPKLFYRGYDVYDPDKVGFISDVPKDAQSGMEFFKYDISVQGNSNQGHRYGTDLSEADKKALIEYLKQL